MDIRLSAADTIIFLDISRVICVFRVFKRMIKYRNGTRPDMREGCNEKLDFKFLKWIWDYPKVKRPTVLMKLEKLSKEKKIIILKSPKEVQNFLNNINT
jgi:adenylate kinase family enzyme